MITDNDYYEVVMHTLHMPKLNGVYAAHYECSHQFTDFQEVVLPSGWKISGYFGNGDAKVFSNFFATHPNYKNITVFGNYHGTGVHCKSRSALKHFVFHHPPVEYLEEK